MHRSSLSTVPGQAIRSQASGLGVRGQPAREHGIVNRGPHPLSSVMECHIQWEQHTIDSDARLKPDDGAVMIALPYVSRNDVERSNISKDA